MEFNRNLKLSSVNSFLFELMKHAVWYTENTYLPEEITWTVAKLALVIGTLRTNIFPNIQNTCDPYIDKW